MWICLPDAFVSVVQDRVCPDVLWVRARRREHLETLFEGREIMFTPAGDYAYRTQVSRAEFAGVVNGCVEVIRYTNFKASVREEELHDLYLDFWTLHRRYQEAGRAEVR